MLLTPTVIYRAFEFEERAKQEKLMNYVENPRRNYMPLDWRLRRSLSPGTPIDWVAADGRARIKAAELILASLGEGLPALRRSSPIVSSVVVTAAHWLVDLNGPHAKIVEEIQQAVRKICRGENFLAIIEPALYPRLAGGGFPGVGAVSWHAHIIVFGADRARIEKRIAAFNASTLGLLKDVPPASLRPRSWNTAARSIAYALKTPAKSHVVYTVPERTDAHTGEIRSAHDWQRAQRLRAGQHVQMRNILADYRLDDLIVVGGSGKELVQGLRDRMVLDREKEIAALRRTRPYPLFGLPPKIKL